MTEAIAFDPQDLLALQPGDVVEVPSPLAPVGVEDVTLVVESNNGSTVTLRASVYEIYLGKFSMNITSEGQVQWSQL